MKKIILGSIVLIFFSLSITVIQMSCSKSADAQNPSGNCIGDQPKMQYKWNGNLSNSDAVFDSRIGWSLYPYAKLISSNYMLASNQTIGNFIRLYFPSSPTLAVGTFSVNNGDCECQINGTFYSKGTFTIIVTTVSNGYAAGTFSGTISTANGSSTITLTEGTFSKVPIVN